MGLSINNTTHWKKEKLEEKNCNLWENRIDLAFLQDNTNRQPQHRKNLIPSALQYHIFFIKIYHKALVTVGLKNIIYSFQ